ncbi:MAG TPA: hypothetical protein V6C76_11615 [Drouetiella sp.]
MNTEFHVVEKTSAGDVLVLTATNRFDAVGQARPLRFSQKKNVDVYEVDADDPVYDDQTKLTGW